MKLIYVILSMSEFIKDYYKYIKNIKLIFIYKEINLSY